MAVEVSFIEGGANCLYSGKTGFGDVLSAADQIYLNPDFEGYRYFLHDFSSIDSFDFDPRLMEDVALQSRGSTYLNHHFLSAVVAQSNQVIEAINAYMLHSKRQVVIFSKMEDAQAWAANFSAKG